MESIDERNRARSGHQSVADLGGGGVGNLFLVDLSEFRGHFEVHVFGEKISGTRKKNPGLFPDFYKIRCFSDSSGFDTNS